VNVKYASKGHNKDPLLTLANKVWGKLKGSCTDPVEIVTVGPDLYLLHDVSRNRFCSRQTVEKKLTAEKCVYLFISLVQ